jgi:hypothetical protein
MSQVIDHADKEHYEKFVQEGIAHCLQERAAKERQDKEANKPVASADN